MRKMIFYSIIVLCIWVFLSQCLIMRNRWSDEKAYKIFSNKKIPLTIHDTIIKTRNLHFALTGADSLPTLVFIHGSPGSWMNYAKYMWDPALGKKFKMVSIDRPGFGYSGFGKALKMQEQCEIILPVLQALKNEKPMYLFGHSMGGPIAIQLAAMDPALFKGIVIAAGSIDVLQEKRETWRRVMNIKPLYWTLPGAFGPSNTELLFLKSDLVLLQKQFAKVTCEVHFIHGTKDNWVPIQNIAYGKKMMLHAKTITVDTVYNADHHIPWKNRARIIKLLLSLD